MGLLISIILSVLIGAGSSTHQLKPPALSPPAETSLPPVCLDESIAKNGIDPGTDKIPKILKNIKKPTRENVTRGYEIPQCQNVGDCDGPDTSDYILVAANVQANYTVFPNNFEEGADTSDRQFVKQTDISGNQDTADSLNNRVFRTFCGDWCSTCNPADVVCEDKDCLKGSCNTNTPVAIPFRGSYHCDFIFYLSDTDDKGRPQIDKNGDLAYGKTNETLPELPADGSLFNVYMRVGAKIPDTLTCPVIPSAEPAKLDLKAAGQKSLKLSTFVPTFNWIKKWAQESKPAIYLYPQKETRVTVKLDPAGYLTVSDPPYDEKNGWQVVAYPDGTIQQPTTHNSQPTTTYPYLYYEAQIDKIPVVKSGFVVKKEELTSFLSDKLQFLGLNNKELQDYLDYWLPRLDQQKENYFLVYFLTKEQTETIEPIDIDMKIDTEIRIRTYFKPLDKPFEIPKQTLADPPGRSGNILVEWGGILDNP